MSSYYSLVFTDFLSAVELEQENVTATLYKTDESAYFAIMFK